MTVLLRDFPLSQFFIEEGRQEGLQEGRQEAKAEALLTVARVRHGELSEQLTSALASSSRGLEELTKLILRAASQTELEQLLAS
jgi:flagellar biosynthesis/type III secretory pathway protein FliH